MLRYILYAHVIVLLAACQLPNVHPLYSSTQLSIQHQLRDEADQAFGEGDYQKAVDRYGKLVDMKPDDEVLTFKWAEALRMNNQLPKAIDVYDRLLRLHPGDSEPLEGKGLAYVQMGDFGRAEAIFTDIVGQDASRWRTVNALGVIHALQGEIDEAVLYYNMAIDLDSANPSVLNNIGLSLALSEQHQEAVKRLRDALALLSSEDSRREKIELNLALAYGIAGDMEHAEPLLRKYLSNAAVFNNLGLYASLNQDKVLARSYLSKALAAHPVHYDKAWENLEAVSQK